MRKTIWPSDLWYLFLTPKELTLFLFWPNNFTFFTWMLHAICLYCKCCVYVLHFRSNFRKIFIFGLITLHSPNWDMINQIYFQNFTTLKQTLIDWKYRLRWIFIIFLINTLLSWNFCQWRIFFLTYMWNSFSADILHC